MKTTTAKTQKEKFVGTVADLADKISVNGSLPLSLQELQFLTRVGDGTFAKRVGFEEKASGHGGKRATIWEFNPSARITLIPANDAAMNESTAAPRRVRRTKAEMQVVNDKAETKVAPSNVMDLSKHIQAAVEGAVNEVLKKAAQAPRRGRPPGTKAVKNGKTAKAK